MERKPAQIIGAERIMRWTLFLGALGLSAIALSFFALAWPLNGVGFDDWAYLWYAHEGFWRVPGNDREFGLVPLLLSEFIAPGRPLVSVATQAISAWLTALLLWRLMWRLLPGCVWFAYLYAVIALLWVPGNLDVSRALYAGITYGWIALETTLAVTALLEAAHQRGRLRLFLAGVAAFSAYAALRSVEATLPLLVLAPALLFVTSASPPTTGLRATSQGELTGRGLLLSMLRVDLLPLLLLWYAAVGVGLVRSFAPLLLSDSSVAYQMSQDASLGNIPARLPEFLAGSLPHLPPVNGMLPGLWLAGIVGAALYGLALLYPRGLRLPTPRQYGLLFGGGLLLTVAAGVPGAYVDYPSGIYRFHTLAQPAQAAMILGAIGGLLALIAPRLSLHPERWLLRGGMLVGFLAGFWMLAAQQHAHDFNADQRRFDESLAFFERITAQVPDVPPDTLLVIHCEEWLYDYNWLMVDNLAVNYLYGPEVRMGSLREVLFNRQEVIYSHPLPFVESTPRAYTYDRLIALHCDEAGPRVATDLAQLNVNLRAPNALGRYDPYARILSEPASQVARLYGR